MSRYKLYKHVTSTNSFGVAAKIKEITKKRQPRNKKK